MKYNVTKLNNGNFAVDAGRGKYFSNTETHDRREAEREALIMSIHWYREMIDRAWERGEKHGVWNDDDNIGDIMA